MAAPFQLQELLRRTEALERRALFLGALGRLLACTLVALPVAALATRFGGLSFLFTGGVAVLGAVVVACVFASRHVATMGARELLGRADARLGGEGVLLALGSASHASSWHAVVEESARRLVELDSGPCFPRPSGRSLHGSMASLLLALLVVFWPEAPPANPDLPGSSAAADGITAARERTQEHSGPAADTEPAGEFALAVTPAKIRHGEDALVTWSWTPRRKSPRPFKLHCVALVRDPDGTEDLGFGPGARPLPLEKEIDLGPDTKGVIERHEDALRRWLAGAGVQGGGTFALSILGIARHENGAEIEFRSPEVRVEVDAPPVASAVANAKSATLEATPAEAPAGKDKPRRGVGGDGRDINLGDAEELGQARLVSRAVKPLLAGAATRRKEVEVFERTAGQRAPRVTPPKSAPPPGAEPVLEVAARRGLRALHAADELRLIDEYFRTSAAIGR